MRRTLTAIALGASLMAFGALAQDEADEAVEAAEAAPVADPAPVLTFRTSAVIAAPAVIEVDGSVVCQMDGDVLRCTARQVQ